MNAGTESLLLDGPAGAIDVALDRPSGAVRAIALIAHPHPLYGGTRDNKVVQTMARALLSIGCVCWRPNFRGVGASEGTHDEGQGETGDLIAVLDQATRHATAPAVDAPVVLAGFSFGGFVQTRVAARLAEQGRPAAAIALVAPAVTRYESLAVPAETLVIHGEEDDVVPLAAVLDWLRPIEVPLVVLPGTGHFFHGRLPLLRRLLEDGVAPRLPRVGHGL